MPTLIILHGWNSSKEKWQKIKELIEAKAPDIQVICLDLPGFKPENQLEKPWNLDDYVNWLNEKLVEVKPPLIGGGLTSADSAIYLLGHSFGGRIAIKFAVKYPEKLKGLILVDAAGIKPRKTFRDKIVLFPIKLIRKFGIKETTYEKGIIKLLRAVFYRYILRRKDYFKANPIQKEIMKNALAEDLKPLLEKIKTKTLIVWGEDDQLTPKKDAYLMKEKIQSSQLDILKGIGHAPHLEAPGILAEKIADFIL
jgi:pimeloyl-ACP methyl ester carboxylesterase